MNRKLSQADRQTIRQLFGTHTHEEIAEAFGVSTRTIDREAAWARSHTVTIRTIPILAGGHIVSVSAGSDVDPEDLRRIREDAEQVIAQFDTDQFRQELRDIEAEGRRIIAEIEAAEIDPRESRLSRDVPAVGIAIPPQAVASQGAFTAVYGRVALFRCFQSRSGHGSDISHRHDLRRTPLQR